MRFTWGGEKKPVALACGGSGAGGRRDRATGAIEDEERQRVALGEEEEKKDGVCWCFIGWSGARQHHGL